MINKKLLALICALSMVLSLTACGGAEQKAADPAPEAVESTDTAEAPEKEEVSEPATEEDTAEETEEVSEESESSAEFSLGTINGNVYENDFLGIRIAVPDDMAFANEEELAQLSSTTADLLKDQAKAKDMIENGSVIIACYASTDNSKSPLYTINLTMQSFSSMGLSAIAVKNFSEEDILSAASDSVIQALGNGGFTNVKTNIEDVEFLGEKHASMSITAEIEGYGTLYEREVVVISNDCIASYTASAFGTDSDETTDVLKYVQKY